MPVYGFVTLYKIIYMYMISVEEYANIYIYIYISDMSTLVQGNNPF